MTGLIQVDKGRLSPNSFRGTLWVEAQRLNGPGICDDEEGEDDGNNVDNKPGTKPRYIRGRRE